MDLSIVSLVTVWNSLRVQVATARESPVWKLKNFKQAIETGKIEVQYADSTNLLCISTGSRDPRTLIVNPGYANESQIVCCLTDIFVLMGFVVIVFMFLLQCQTNHWLEMATDFWIDVCYVTLIKPSQPMFADTS